MPYILQQERKLIFDEKTGLLNANNISSIGELNFAITTLILHYLKIWEKNYSTYNSIVGMLECVKIEFYRRVMVYHEEKAIKNSGDVY